MAVRAGTAFIDFKGDFSSIRKEIASEVTPLTSRFSRLGKAGEASFKGIRSGALSAGQGIRGLDSQLSRTQRGLQGADRSSKNFDRSTRSLGTSLRGVAKTAAAAATAYIGISQIGSAISATENLAKTTISLNRNLGFSVKSASELGATLQARGVDTKKASQAFATFAGQVRSAREGSASAAANFKALGISQRELKNSSPEQTLSLVADGLHGLGRGFDRTDVSRKLFGRGWQDLSPILREGSGSLREQMDLANKYGASFSGKTIQGPKDLIKAQRELKIAQLGLQVQFTRDVAPALIAVGQGFATLINGIRQATPAVKGLVAAGGILVIGLVSIPAAIAAFNALRSAITDTASWISRAASNISGFVSALIPVKIAVAAIGLVFGQVRGLIAPMMPVVQSIARVFGTILVGQIKVAWQVLKGFGNVVGNVVGIVSNLLRGDFGGAWKNAKQLVVGVLGTIKSTVVTAFAAIKSSVRGVGTAIGKAFSGVVGLVKTPLNNAIAAVETFLGAIATGLNILPFVSGVPHPSLPRLAKGGLVPAQGQVAGYARGSKIMAPTAIVGEESPRHPEFVIATNPSYRQRNLKLWAQAGGDLGIPGFAEGGRISRSEMHHHLSAGVPGFIAGGWKDQGTDSLKAITNFVGSLPSPSDLGWFASMGSYAVGKATSWAKSKAPGLYQGGILQALARGGVIQQIRKKGNPFLSTAYGPPWNAINGTGVTATGVNLTKGPAKQIVAVDPSVVPLHSRLSIWPNPFKSLDPFAAEDTGGAIKGNRIDFYDWKGREHQMAWGRKGVRAMKGSVGNVPAVKKTKGKGSGKAKKLGLGAGLQAQIDATTGRADIDAEYAQRADTIGGSVFGQEGLSWLQAELNELFALRNLLIRAIEQLKEALANLGVGKVAKGKGRRGGAGSTAGGIGPHGENDGYAKSGLVDYPVPTGKMASWVAGALNWAKTKHGFSGRPTSGYRSAAYNASQGRYGGSEHEGTAFPRGAVDFGSPSTGLLIKRAFVAATQDYKWPMKNPIGFVDDGHASGTGHYRGGILGLAANHGLPGFKKGGKPKGTASKAAAAIKKQKDAITAKIGEVTSALTDVQGIGSSMDVGGAGSFPLGSLGGRILDVQSSIKDYGGDTGGSAGPKGFSVEDLKSVMALKGLGVSFTPDQFAGVFHDGGIVRVPRGGEGVAVVKNKEGVFTEGQMAAMGRVPPSAEVQAADLPVVELKFADGMGWLREFITVEIKNSNRKTALAAQAGVRR